MTSIITNDPDAYQYLVRHAAHLEQLAGHPVLPIITFDGALAAPPVTAVADAVGDDAGDDGPTPLESETSYAPAYVRGAVRTHAVEIRRNRKRRSAERYTLCDRGKTRIVDRALYEESVTTVSCAQCVRRLETLGVLPAAA